MSHCTLGMRFAWAALAVCLFGSTALAQEFRAFWIDAWGAGFRSQSQVDALLGVPGNASSRGTIRDANCNAVIVQVRRRADVCYPSAMGEPYFSGLSPSNFNALQAMINAAHDTTGGKQRVEVHCWIVTFATDGGTVYTQHNNPASPDNYWVTLDNNGNETADKAFDPGHPKCLQYLTNVCMDLVNNFDIDGLHYDYIRFTANNQGYNPTSIARYNARYGLTGQPSASNEQFKQWRRDQVTALVRKVYANIQASKPWVKQSASVVTWNPSPVASTRAAFMNTRPYYDVYADWDAWMQEGILDMSVPMTYYDQGSLPNDYQRWINYQKDRKGNRHNIVGPGIYLNSLSNAILQIQKTRETTAAGNKAEGFSGYSYRVPYEAGTWAGFAPELVANVTPSPTTIPIMPWKTAPTKGHMMGTVTYAGNNAWADGATVTLTAGPESRTMLCDGTGFYAFIDLTPGAYTVSVSKTGYVTTAANVTVTTGQMAQRNMQLSTVVVAPQIQNVRVTAGVVNATVSWDTTSPADSLVRYGPGSYTLTAGDSGQLTSHSIVLEYLQPDTIYNYQIVSTNAAGSAQTSGATFRTMALGAEIVVDNTDSGWANTSPNGNTWTLASLPGVPKIGTTYLYATGVTSTAEASATHKCTWTPNLPFAGRYDVYAYYQQGTNRTTSAPYKVVYSGGSVTSIQNQYSTSSLGGWFLLGADLPFEAGMAGYVQLSNNAGNTGLVSADAVKFVPRPDTTPPSTPVVTDEGVQTTNRTSLSASWTSGDPESGIQKFEYRILRQGHGVARDWTNAGTQIQIDAAGLALPIGTYSFEVRATNHTGLVSSVGSSDGIVVFSFDANQNNRVDASDTTQFRLCQSGDGNPYSADENLQCGLFDADSDGDVDQGDFGVFQRCITGSLITINLGCVNY